MGRSVDGDEDDAVFYLFRDFLDACWTRHQRVRLPATTSVGTSKAAAGPTMDTA
jgi:hypothetical protein